MKYKGTVLTIAGSDSGGGAGIQADIKTITSLGFYAASCITAITAQNTYAVDSIYELAAGAVAKQIEVVCADIQFGAVKIGMLPNIQAVMEVNSALPRNIPIVLDPVMVATSGGSLSDIESIEALKKNIIPRSTIITPNIFEAEKLVQMKIDNLSDMISVAKRILLFGSEYVLIKGGHLKGNIISSFLLSSHGGYVFSHPRVEDCEFHGIGCSLSSAIACFIAQGLSMNESVKMALHYIIYAISGMSKIGSGHSPISHNRFILEKTNNYSLAEFEVRISNISSDKFSTI